MKISILSLWIFLSLGSFAAAEVRPNILFIMTDDQAAWTTGYSGNADARTPALDHFRQEARSFKNTFVNSAVCSPSRAALITSRLPSELGIMEYIRGGSPIGVSKEFVTWPRLLQKSGYFTGLIGKWHLGYKPEHHPRELGYEYYSGFIGGSTSTINPKIFYNDLGKSKKVKGFTVDVLTDEAIHFLKSRPSDKPFALSLHYRAPHTKYLPVSDGIMEAAKERDYQLPDFPGLSPRLKTHMRDYLASVSHIDQNFARLMKSIENLGLRENTIVIFTSDHGYNIGHHGATHKGNGSWAAKGNKSYHHPGLAEIKNNKMPNMWDTSLRVPCLIRWPAKVKANSSSNGIVSFVDFFPTLCKLAGAKIPEGTLIRGKDFSSLLTSDKPEWKNPFLIQHDIHNLYVLRGWRNEKWKIIKSYNYSFGFMYDLENDPDETKNLYAMPEFKKQRDELISTMELELKKLNDPVLKEGKYLYLRAKNSAPQRKLKEYPYHEK